MKLLTPYKLFEDQRGKLVGIINNGCWREMNILESKKDAIRGGHYHKETLELFYFLEGKVEVVIRNLSNNKVNKLTVNKGDILLIEPNELHTFTMITNAVWINALSQPMDQVGCLNDIHTL